MTPEHFTATPPVQIGAWLACLAFVLMVVNQGFKFSRNVKGPGANPPNELLGASHLELERRINNVEDDIKNLRDQLTEDNRGVADKLENLRLEQKKDLETQTARFEKRFDDLPEKVINVLKNTGAIGQHTHRRTNS
jgi:ribosomal protein S28E/S33